jgi:predicted phage baseplate assembly protein
VSALAPNLFDRRFDDLIEIGRARLRPLAPEWTDHNAHDPGITLMELLAWTAEAQLYSVSRMRRDERTAYAALLGLHAGGTRGAQGLIWSDRQDPDSPAATFKRTLVIAPDAVVNVASDQQPTFRPLYQQLWVPGRIERLETRSPGGRTVDHTSINARGGPAFQPLGDAGPTDVLALTFACRDDAGLFGRNRQVTDGARLTIGVLTAASSGGAPEVAGPAGAPAWSSCAASLSSLSLALIAGGERFPLSIVADTSQGLLTTGAIVLDLSSVTSSPAVFTIEMRAPRGLPRPPRVRRIEVNVIPIRQGRVIDREVQPVTPGPDRSFALNEPGLRFAAGEEPVIVEVDEPTGLQRWTRTDRLSHSGPDEPVYDLDPVSGVITFGNGLNGRMPGASGQVNALVSYAVSDGGRGNVGRNRRWSVGGFPGVYGVNVDPVAGGAEAAGRLDQRRDARQLSLVGHALISADDLVGAATGLPLLEVARAWVVVPGPVVPRTGVVTLVAMRSRAGGDEPEQAPETSRWLDAIRRRLLPQVPLGTRLAVVGPRYTGFTIAAKVEVQAGRNPEAVKAAIGVALRRRLALVEQPGVTTPRQPGIEVTERDVRAWVRSVDGVRRVIALELRGADRRPVQVVAVPHDGLPRWNTSASTFDVTRPAPGGTR